MSEEANGDRSPGDRRRLRSFVLLAASSLTVMAGAAISPALPVIEAHFDRGGRDVELLTKLLLTLPALFIVAGAPLAGLVVDRWGRRQPLFWSIGVYAAAGGSGLVLSTLPGLLIGRAVLGLAVAGLMTAATALIGDLFEGSKRERFFGWQGAAMGFSGVAFTLGSGALAELGWRWPFAVYLGALALLPPALAALGWKRADRKGNGEINLSADRKTKGEAAPRPVAGQTALAYALALTGMAFFYMVPVQLPFLIERLTGETGIRAGIPLAALPLFGTMTSLSYHRLRRTLRISSIFALLFLLMGGGYVCLAVAGSWRAICLGAAISGLGMGFMMPNLQVFALRSVAERWRGRIAGGLTTCLFLGQFLSPLLVWPLVRLLGRGDAIDTSGEGLSLTFGLAGVLMVTLGMAFALWTAVVKRGEREKMKRREE